MVLACIAWVFIGFILAYMILAACHGGLLAFARFAYVHLWRYLLVW